MALSITPDVFWGRAKRSQRCLAENSSFDVLLVWMGKDDQGREGYKLSKSYSLYLLQGYEFPETLFCITKDTLVIGTSEKKIKMLKDTLKTTTNKDSVVWLERGKTKEEWESKIFNRLGEFILKGMRVALVADLNTLFGAALHQALVEKGMTVALNEKGGIACLESVMFQKDETAIKLVKEGAEKLAKVADTFRRKFPELDQEDESITLASIAAKFEKDLSVSDDVLPCVRPSVQSGGAVNVSSITAQPLDPNARLTFDIVLISLGLLSNGYNTYVARTVFVDPSESLNRAYTTLVQAHERAMASLKPGGAMSDAFHAASRVCEAAGFRLGSLDVGFGVGTLAVESEAHSLVGSNSGIIVPNATFVVCTTLSGAQNEAGESCSLRLADTILVGESENSVLTESAKSAWPKIHFCTEQDEEEEHDDDDGNKKNDDDDDEDVQVNRRVTRAAAQTHEQRELDKQKRAHDVQTVQRQKERMMRKAEIGMGKSTSLNGSASGNGAGTVEEEAKIIRAYKSARDYPSQLRGDGIHIDDSAECVFLPIAGMHIPFHVSTIKNISRVDDMQLRFNFYFAGATIPKEVGPEMRRALNDFPNLAYVKELSFQSRDQMLVGKIVTDVKALQKKVRERQKREFEVKDLVEQRDLILLKERTKENPATLSDVCMLPSLGRGASRCVGRLRAHVNGFRFSPDRSGENVDVLYSNVKCLFFQPSAGELRVLVHLYLRNPIMVGKYKTRHVQFFTEVVSGSSALNARGGDSKFDPDEIEEEERERRLRSKLDKTFAAFVEQSYHIARENGHRIGQEDEVEFVGKPKRAVNGVTPLDPFSGTPFREMVKIWPTAHALVNLTEKDFLVVYADEVEHIHFERVSLDAKVKNFDIRIIWKTLMATDGSADHLDVQNIDAIAFGYLDTIREWIDRQEGITCTMGTAGLHWQNIMQGVREELSRNVFWSNTDPKQDDPAKPIGWLFLQADDDDEENEDDDEDEDEDGSDEEFSVESGASSEESSSWGSVVDEEEDDEEEEDDDEDEDDDDDGYDSDEEERKLRDEDAMADRRDVERGNVKRAKT